MVGMQHQSNGGILEVCPAKIKRQANGARTGGDVSKDLYFFDNRPFTD
jgi:hypothetical protein